MVIDLLRRQFVETSIIKTYVNAYQEKLKRSHHDKFRRRASAQKSRGRR